MKLYNPTFKSKSMLDDDEVNWMNLEYNVFTDMHCCGYIYKFLI